MLTRAIIMKIYFGGLGGCCSKFVSFIPFGEVYEQVLLDGNELFNYTKSTPSHFQSIAKVSNERF